MVICTYVHACFNLVITDDSNDLTIASPTFGLKMIKNHT